MGILSSGLLAPEEAMDLLLIGPSYAQVAIKTEKAARQLQWLRSERKKPMRNWSVGIMRSPKRMGQNLFVA
jgi:cytochrome c551/c552